MTLSYDHTQPPILRSTTELDTYFSIEIYIEILVIKIAFSYPRKNISLLIITKHNKILISKDFNE